MTTTVAPSGSWKSPIMPDLIVAESVGLSQIVLDGVDVYWIESRPMEGGRNVVVRLRAGAIEDVLPAPFNARSQAHEYGGGAFSVDGGTIYFSNFSDQQVYGVVAGAAPRALTPPNNLRFADFTLDHRRQRLIGVCEDHRREGEPVNALVVIDPEAPGEPRILVAGSDFYASPHLSPDGTQLAWLCWNHPNMPWDGTELWRADITPEGSLGAGQKIAGGPGESIFQPEFSPDGTLYFVSDRSGWWNLYRLREGDIEALVPMEAEFGLPQWNFGMSTYAFESAQRLVCAYNQKGVWHLATLETDSLRLVPREMPCTEIHCVRAANGKAFFIAGSPTQSPAIIQFDLATNDPVVIRRSNRIEPDPGYVSAPQTIEFPATGGGSAYAFYYPPQNRDFQALPNEKPPLLVLSHGGPTSATSSTLNLKVQYWTSRGIAVLDVNYRGSTGYGRAYRDKLKGQWGVADVEDCIAGARHLIARGLVDEQRIAIRGGSAGGYTTLCALTFHDLFRAGAVYYGISDLEALAKDTHKFEARYLDGLIGPYPARRDIYQSRSPIHFVDRLSCPVIFFQGMEDKVVPPNQAEAMVEALRQKDIAVVYVPFAGEQHGFRRAENIKRALEAELYFYSRIFRFTPADVIQPVMIENLPA
ncbi:MAG: S9 family peptidase [Pseudomonadota bacterium]